MSYAIPKFAYDAGSGIIDFIPTYPPTKKTPLAPLEATRSDSITTSGLKQSVFSRTDKFVNLQFETVPESDLQDWEPFFEYALTGDQFTYYPDSTDEDTYVQYTLEDQSWSPTWKAPQTYSFSMKMRQVVGGISSHFS